MKTDFSNNDRFSDDDSPMETSERKVQRLFFGHKVHRSTLLIGLMFVLGAGWVFWESRSIAPRSAAADSVTSDPNITMNLDQMRMEAAIGQIRETRKQQIFEPLHKDAQRRCLQLNSLSRDPFESVMKKDTPDPVPAATQPVEEVVVEEPPPSVEGLELQSILIGAVPTAIINGYLIQEGQVIADWKVVEIQPTKVVLQWRKHKHVLTMP